MNFKERYLYFNHKTIRSDRLVVEKLPDDVPPTNKGPESSINIVWDEQTVQVGNEIESIRIEKRNDSEKLTFWYRRGPGCVDLFRCADRFEVSGSDSRFIVHLYRYSKDRPYVDLSPSQHPLFSRCMYLFFR